MDNTGYERSALLVTQVEHRDTFRKSTLNFFVDKIIGRIKDSGGRKEELMRRIKTITFDAKSIDSLLLSILRLVFKVEYGSEKGKELYDNYINQREIGERVYFESKRYFDIQSMLVAMMLNKVDKANIETSIIMSVDRVRYTKQCTYDSSWLSGVRPSTDLKIRCGMTLLENRPTLYDRPTDYDMLRDSIIVESALGKVVITNCMPTTAYLKYGSKIPVVDSYKVFTLTIYDMVPENPADVDKADARGIKETILKRLQEMFGIDEMTGTSMVQKYGYIERGNLDNGNLIICVFDRFSSMLFSISNNLIALIVSIASQKIRPAEAAVIQRGYGYDFPTNLTSIIIHALQKEYSSDEVTKVKLYNQIYTVIMKGLASQSLHTGDSAREATLALLTFGYAYDIVDRLITMSDNPMEVNYSLGLLDRLRSIAKLPGEISRDIYHSSEYLLQQLTNTQASLAEKVVGENTARICDLLDKYNKSRWFETSN